MKRKKKKQFGYDTSMWLNKVDDGIATEWISELPLQSYSKVLNTP